MLSLLAAIPLILMLVGIAVGALLGFRRGFFSSAIRLGTVILSAIIAFFVARALGDALGTMLMEQGAFDSLLGGISGEGEIFAEIITDVEALVLPLPIYLLIVPVVFVPVFLLVKWLTYIVYAIVAKVLRLKKWGKSFLLRKIGGVAVGALQGLVVAVLCLMPLAGLSTLVVEVEEVIVDEKGEYPDGTEEIFEIVDGLTDNTAVNISGALGGKLVYGALSSAEIEGINCNLSEGAVSIFEVVSDATILIDMDWTEPHLHKDEIKLFIDDVHDSEYVSVVLAKIFNSFGAIATENMNELIPDTDGPYADIMLSAMSVFYVTTPETLHDDLNTMFDALFVLGENGVIEKMESSPEDEVLNALTKELEDGTLVIDRVVDILAENPHTLRVVESLTKLSITIMCDSMGMDEDATVVYENLKSEVNSILKLNRDSFASEEAYRSKVSYELDSALQDNDIELEAEVIDEMTDYIAENYADTSEISDADVQKAILSYYGAYAKEAE